MPKNLCLVGAENLVYSIEKLPLLPLPDLRITMRFLLHWRLRKGLRNISQDGLDLPLLLQVQGARQGDFKGLLLPYQAFNSERRSSRTHRGGTQRKQACNRGNLYLNCMLTPTPRCLSKVIMLFYVKSLYFEDSSYLHLFQRELQHLAPKQEAGTPCCAPYTRPTSASG